LNISNQNKVMEFIKPYESFLTMVQLKKEKKEELTEEEKKQYALIAAEGKKFQEQSDKTSKDFIKKHSDKFVSLLLMENKLGGFHFNDSKYGDDDLTAGALKPYQLFLIFNELVEGMDARGMNHAKDLGWMIDASHNIKDPLEDLLQSVEAIMIAYAQALLVDRKALNAAQDNNDVAKAQEILQNTFRSDLRALVAEARLRAGAALAPTSLYRDLSVRSNLVNHRGNTVATGL
jgi:L-rhamnose isomerase/sugar isomerase